MQEQICTFETTNLSVRIRAEPGVIGAVSEKPGGARRGISGPFVEDGALTRERFRVTAQYFVANDSGQAHDFRQCSFDRALLPIVTLTALSGESTGGISSTAIVLF
jgi:hypothetical protein